MRNLNLWRLSARKLKIESKGKLVVGYGHNVNHSSVDQYICTSDLILRKYDEDHGDIQWSKDLNDCVSTDNSAIDVAYLTLSGFVCVGFSNGELFTIADEGTLGNLVGVCDSGILAMKWSADQELLVIVTKDMKAILMSFTFEPVNEINLLDDDFGKKQFITVGWGKKETQFHGSEGKHARVKSEVTAEPQSCIDDRVKISWRGDCQLYAIGFVKDGIRRFKVFDREGQLQYTSEKQQGLESNLCWRPIGNVIATTQILQDKYEVAFFEKNGLKHGGFTIPLNSTTHVEDLLWSSDSEILALLCVDSETNFQSILLFTSSNYHWFLKQTLLFDKKQKISNVMWDINFEVVNHKKLHILLNNGENFTYSWAWNYDHSKGKNDNDDAVINVIDGKKSLVTGFRQTIVPPPMAAFEIELESNANSVHFAPENDDCTDSNTFFVVTANNKLIFYSQTQKLPLQYKKQNVVKLDQLEFPFQYFNWFWLNSDTIVCVKLDNIGNYHLVEWSLETNELVRKHAISLPEAVIRIQSNPLSKSSIFLELITGDIIKYDLGGSLEPLDISLDAPCLRFDVMSLDNELHFLGLTQKGKFLLNDTKIMDGVSSFFVHTHFILLTTFQHEFLCTKLTRSGLNSLNIQQNNDSPNVYRRKIERGTRLVIAVPKGIRTIFQMPRGNLETIQPRPLSLKIIGEYLDSLKYYEAFDLMRKQRINLNLIYDHNPEIFLNHVDIFLEKITNNSWLSLFLSDLDNCDVTETMYASTYSDQDKLKRRVDNKINTICNIIRTHINKRTDNDCKVLPIITSFVKTNTDSDLECALSLIKQLKLQETGGFKLPVGSDEALKFLLYMVDVSHLFDVALGMYDFDLVLLVANKSQKDPKEYVPMLNELDIMDEDYKKFTINKHLKRFDRAVHCLAKCGPEKHEEMKTFVKYHSLYREALKLFNETDEIYKQISDDFGLYLRLKKQYLEAGIVYEKAGNFNKAIDCYKDALEWEFAIKLAQKWPTDQFRNLCWELVCLFKEEKRHEEAIKILEQFYDNIEETIMYAVDNGLYKTAIRLCNQHKMDDIKDNKLLPALLEEYKNLFELVHNNIIIFNRHKQRLHFVRENKLKNPEPIDYSYNNKDSDLYSDVGSTLASSQSRSSSRTYRSSKNRRKHERKVASLKEGSQYEDVALIIALHNLIVSTHNIRSQVRELNIALTWFGKDKEALILQTIFAKLLKDMKDSCREIWTNKFMLEVTQASIEHENVSEGCAMLPQGLAVLEPHMRFAPVFQDIKWKIDGLSA